MSDYRTRRSFARSARSEHNWLMAEANETIEQAKADREAAFRAAADERDARIVASTVVADPDHLRPGDLVWRHVRGHWSAAMVRTVTPKVVVTDTGIRIPRGRELRKVPDESTFRPGARP